MVDGGVHDWTYNLQFAGGKYENPTCFLTDSEEAFRSVGVPESDWLRMIGNQFGGVATDTVVWLELSWTEFCAELADRLDDPAFLSHLSTRQWPDKPLTDFCMYKLNLHRGPTTHNGVLEEENLPNNTTSRLFLDKFCRGSRICRKYFYWFLVEM